MEKSRTSWNENRTAKRITSVASCHIENVFSPVIKSMSFHGRLVHTVMQMQLQTQTQMEMQASWHVQSKHKEKEIRKRSRSIFPRWPTMIELFTESHVWEANANTSSRKWKFVYSLRWRLRLHLHLRWVGSQVQFLAFAFVFLCDWLTELGVCTNPITLLGN